MATRRQDPVARETLGVWTLFAVDAAAIFATYSREPLSQLYHVSGTGPAAGAGRVLVFLNFPIALAALALLAFVTTRATRAVGVLAAVLCAVVFWPGIVNQADLDARWVNVVPAAGVLLALALTTWRAASSGISRPARHRGDGWRIAAAVVVLVAALPWAAAELGLFVGDMSAWWAPPGQARLHPAVHHGHHHGMDGTLLVLTALLLSRALARLPAGLRTAVGLYLGVLLTYGLGNMLNDDSYEQLVKRGWASSSTPSVLLPAPSLAWALILVVGLAIGVVFLRVADEGSPPRRTVPRVAAAVPVLAVVALLAIGAAQHRQRTAHTPFARTGSGTIVFSMAPGGTFHRYEIGADGRGLRRLTNGNGSHAERSSSHDGKRAFEVDSGGRGHIETLTADGNVETLHTRGDSRFPAWAPRGDLLAYECRTGEHWQICTFDPRSGTNRVLTSAGSDAFAPAWSPDGRRIAFIGDRDGNDQLYVMGADGGELVRLTRGQADKDAPAWRS